MNHRQLFCAALVLTAGVLQSHSAEVTRRQPNIIYINTDDWGIGKVPVYEMDAASQRIIRTPNIDRLRHDGMKFTNAYAGNAVCGPSRCSLLTGKHPGHAAWRANRGAAPVKWLPDYPLLGEVARRAGYTTAGFGKLSGGGHDKPENITRYGWDYWLGFLGHVDCRDFYSPHIWENGRKKPLPRNTPKELKGTILDAKNPKAPQGLVPDGKGTFVEDLYADKIIEFMGRNRNKPFFIYFASTVPHGGVKGKPEDMRVPDMEGYDQMPDLTRREQVYCALMTRHDKNVGRIRQALGKLGLTENTIVIWTSDNGDEDSYYDRTKTFDGNGPFKGVKRYLHEGGIRVPLIACWPGTIPPGSSSDLITTQWDLMPTLADAGGKEITSEMDGISILPTLHGEADKQTGRDYIYFEFYERGRQQSVRMGNWKGYRLNGPGNPLELHRLDTDPSEKNNIASAHPEVVKKIEEIMLKEHEEHPVWGFDKPSKTGNRKK